MKKKILILKVDVTQFKTIDEIHSLAQAMVVQVEGLPVGEIETDIENGVCDYCGNPRCEGC